MNHRQATHLVLYCFGVLEPPGDAWNSYQFLVLDEGPGNVGPTARRREQNVSILLIFKFWEIVQPEKRCDGICVIIRCCKNYLT